MTPVSPTIFREAVSLADEDPVIAGWLSHLDGGGSYGTFEPRPDKPAQFDQQYSFCHNRDSVSFLVGGNASGTTEASAYKTAQMLLCHQPPPRPGTPFWLISNTYDQVCSVCWGEKLLDHGHIPESEIDWDHISWHDLKQNQPRSVPLKPWPREKVYDALAKSGHGYVVPRYDRSRHGCGGINKGCKMCLVEQGTLSGSSSNYWLLCMKSYEQGRTAMQARSIGGFWFSEQFPLNIFIETLRGCREYMFPGCQFAEFTPIDPDLSMWVETLMEDPPPGWVFYRANTELNKPNLVEGWFEQFFATVPDELMETRMTGALASFEGVIYQAFIREVHVIDETETEIPPGCYHWMGTDWGASEEHAHVTLWACRDGKGDWLVYDEYVSTDQAKITVDHVDETLDRCAAWGWPIGKTTKMGHAPRRLAIEQDAHYGMNYADPSRPGEIQEYNRRGIPTAPANNRVYEGINSVRSLLKANPHTQQPRMRISSRCKTLINNLRTYRWKRGRKAATSKGSLLNPQVAQPVPLKLEDDTCDAVRYLLHTVMQQDADMTPRSARRERETRKSIQVANEVDRIRGDQPQENGQRRSFAGVFAR